MCTQTLKVLWGGGGQLLRLHPTAVSIFFLVPRRCTDLDPVDCLFTRPTGNAVGGCG